MEPSRLERYCLDFEEKRVEIGIIEHDTEGVNHRFEVYEIITWKKNEFPSVCDIKETTNPYELYGRIKRFYDDLFDIEFYTKRGKSKW